MSTNNSSLTAVDILQRVFGYKDFRYQQATIIDTIVQGGDALILMPTGGGKSLCYQIPALMRAGTGIVISPLIALMKDQVDALNQLGVKAAFINSTLSNRECNAVEQALLGNKLDLLYIAPERLLMNRMLDLLHRTTLALFAIDEAHCVSQWGHDFRKEYQQLHILQQYFPQIPRIALTATADMRTRQEIIQQLALTQAQVFVHSFDRPNICYQISAASGSARSRLWAFLQKKHPTDAGIVYCLSRKMVEQVAQWLRTHGRDALPYHAGLHDEERTHYQERFLREDGVIIVATVAFGMGIDKPDVRFVAHLSLPKSIEAYYQETGRAGRDGLPANAWLAYGLQDVITLRDMLRKSDAEPFFQQVALQKLESMLGFCELTECRRQALLGYFSEHSANPCGNCDNCLSPPETWDATVAAQKALSCVYRTGQRFGVSYLVDVLLGKTTDARIAYNGHDRVSTFGIGQDIEQEDWFSVYRQLIARGCLETDPEGYGGLRLTQQAKPFLAGKVPISIRKRLPTSKQERDKPLGKAGEERPQDVDLLAALRLLRKELAKAQGVSPFIIFHDTTLLDLVAQRPQNIYKLSRIIGLGEHKISHYGEALLACIAQFPLPPLLNNNYSVTVNQTLMLFVQGKNPEVIAQERGLVLGTIYGHFTEAIGDGLLDVKQVLELADEDYEVIQQQIMVLHVCKSREFKPLYEALLGKYNYGVLKCVAAAVCRKAML